MKRALRFAAVVAMIITGAMACSDRAAARSTIECGAHGAAPADRSGPQLLDTWLSAKPLCIAHRGGDANWVEGTADAYRQAAAWSSRLALEVPVWRTADGVWVVSEDPSTKRVFGTDRNIRSSTWATLSVLRSEVGGFPMARLIEDVLRPYGTTRILFVDNKAGQDLAAFFDVLGHHAGPSRYVIKSHYPAVGLPAEAHRRGYKTWGYYYERDLSRLRTTQGRFDLLGLNYTAPASAFATMRATGKPVIAHVIGSAAAAKTALDKGADGLMVSAVEEVVRR